MPSTKLSSDASREVAIGEQLDVDKGPAGPDRPPDENGAGNDRAGHEPDDKRREPATMRSLLQCDLQSRQTKREQHQGGRVEAFPDRPVEPFARQKHQAADAGDYTGRDIDEKKPMPRIGLSDPATDDRSDRWCQHRKHAGNRRCYTLQPRWKEQEDRSENGRDEHAA